MATRLMLLLILLSIQGCDAWFYKKPAYIGGYVTQTGTCNETGKLVISVRETNVTFSFFCFLKECHTVSGYVLQGGYLNVHPTAQTHVSGRLQDDQATGEWALNINNQFCSGHWAAMPNR